MSVIAKLIAILVMILATPIVFIIHVWTVAVSAEETFSEWIRKELPK